jgi:predicted Zn-dependent protease
MMAEKKFLQAAKAYETAYGLRKSGGLAIKLHAAYTQAGKSVEGDARLSQWLKESPTDAAARLYVAAISLERRDYKEAITHYEWLREKQPDNVLVLNNLAWSYHQVKDSRAVDTAERAYKLKPDSPAVADTLGTILVEQGNTKRGLELLQNAVAAAPKAHQIRYHLAQGWLKAGDKSKARDELERLLSNDAKFPQQAEAQNLLKQLRN